jgi:hypothetical protein
LDRLANELAAPVGVLEGGAWSVARLGVLLDRAELRAWEVEACDVPGLGAGHCPLGSGRSLIAWSRTPVGGPVHAGSWLVARALPVGPGRWVVLGRATVVSESAPRLEVIVNSLRAPRGEFWRVHGALIARIARSLASGTEQQVSAAMPARLAA